MKLAGVKASVKLFCSFGTGKWNWPGRLQAGTWMYSDPETSLFSPRHKELRAAVCVRSGRPPGNWISDKIPAPSLHFWSGAAGVASAATYCQYAKNIRFRERGFGGTPGEAPEALMWFVFRSALFTALRSIRKQGKKMKNVFFFTL